MQAKVLDVKRETGKTAFKEFISRFYWNLIRERFAMFFVKTEGENDFCAVRPRTDLPSIFYNNEVGTKAHEARAGSLAPLDS